MKKILSLMLVYGCLVAQGTSASTPQQELRRVYVRAGLNFPVYRSIGQPHPMSQTKFSLFGDVALGIRFKQKLSVEIEGTQACFKSSNSSHPLCTCITNENANMTYSTIGGFVNVLFHPQQHPWNGFTTHIGGGVGIFNNKTTDITVKGFPILAKGTSQQRFAWQIIAGTSWSISENLDFLLGLKFTNWNKFSNIETDNNYKFDGTLQVLRITAGFGWNL